MARAGPLLAFGMSGFGRFNLATHRGAEFGARWLD